MIKRLENARPVLHFTPESGWINDPNGLLYDGKQYHLFAQHNPNDIVWGPMHWLHAVSDDLLHWKPLGIALYPDSLGTMFSGSAVIDVDNTAGFGHGTMIAIYTQHGERECQSIAFSQDGVNFVPYDGNPVIENPGVPDFRDPKVFRDEKEDCWRMVLAAGNRIEFYRSADLRNFCKTGSFGEEICPPGLLFECPDLFPLAAPDGREIWVLLVSVAAPPEAGGGRMCYFLGDFDGVTFRQTDAAPNQTLIVDKGFDDYAGVTFNGTRERIFLGWAANPIYAGNVPASLFRGRMTLPRKLQLVDTDFGIRLAAEPFLPGAEEFPIADGGTLKHNVYLLTLSARGAFEIRLENSRGEMLRVGLDEDNHIFADRSLAGETDFDAWFGKPHFDEHRIARVKTGTFKMMMIVDHDIIELYADQGTYVSTMLVFPSERYDIFHILGMANATISTFD